MSVQFGRWNFEGQPPAPDYIEKASAAIAPYGPDSNESYSNGGLKILYRAFYTTKESHLETQPHIAPSGAVITWDGRLDNRAQLISELPDPVAVRSTDVEIVAAAYEKWGIGCFANLIGDWALSIWNPSNRSLILAKDPIGNRHLYYSIDKDHVTWCTIVDPLVLFAGRTFTICKEYIAGWFSYFPAAHLTPYVGIQSVPPSSSVAIRAEKHTVNKYWDFDPAKRIRYRTDAEYEEHFRAVFAKAVQRRLRSDSPILAELSGGMDSSSIVCVADTVIARGAAETPRLDTISWYDDSYDHIESDTNEQRFFTKVEQKRGRMGYQINLRSLKKDASSKKSFGSEFDNDRFAAIPSPNKDFSELSKQYAAHMLSQGNRVTLSGIGGDEVTGGEAPAPTPELQNLMARARFGALTHKLNAWAAKTRKPPLVLLWEAARGFVSLSLTGLSIEMCPAPWFHSAFVRRNYGALCGYPSRVKLFGPLPSFQKNIAVLNVLRRLLANCPPQPDVLREARFPYLDRDFLEFLYAIPREQIVGVGKRRFLMKRALVGIVPDELLNRRRKAFLPQGSKKDNSTEWPCLAELRQHLVGSFVGVIDPNPFLEALQKGQNNEDVPNRILGQTLRLESWLRHLTVHRVLTNPTEKQRHPLALEAKKLSGPTPPETFS
jgi:asparagine synthase (glutamine-hydrolysing)